MRNLLEYPVTKKEILDFLMSLLDDYHEEAKHEFRCGDMSMTLLSEAIKIVEGTENYEFRLDSYPN